jgi:hypothetical protein
VGDREKDTERAAMMRRIVERFVLGLPRAPLDPRRDDGLGDLRQRRCLARGRGRCHGRGDPGHDPDGCPRGPAALPSRSVRRQARGRRFADRPGSRGAGPDPSASP